MGVVASTATASTGTPITALSGAAAHNATLAAMGGGATAGGGLGMAAGEIALGGMSFGVGTLFFVGTGYLFKRMDEAEQKATIRPALSSRKRMWKRATSRNGRDRLCTSGLGYARIT
jgi:hypothetical protein